MLTETEFARLLTSWKNQLGEEIRGRMCVSIEGRLEMYKTLINTLVQTHGYTEDDLMGKTYRMVIEASVNPKSEKVGVWRELATQDWMAAVDVFFPKQMLIHDPNTEFRPVVPTRNKPEPTPEAEPVIEDLGPMAITQEEFDILIAAAKRAFDKEFLVDMLTTPAKKMTKKQTEILQKIKNRAVGLQKIKNSEEAVEEESLDPRLKKEDLVDRSLVEGLPPVVHEQDDEFLKLIASIGGENE